VAAVQATTQNFATVDRYFEFAVGAEVALSNVFLRPGEGVVVRWSADVVENTCGLVVGMIGLQPSSATLRLLTL